MLVTSSLASLQSAAGVRWLLSRRRCLCVVLWCFNGNVHTCCCGLQSESAGGLASHPYQSQTLDKKKHKKRCSADTGKLITLYLGRKLTNSQP